MKTRAAVLYEYGKPLVIEELELSAPKEKEVLVKNKAAGLCHSDLSGQIQLEKLITQRYCFEEINKGFKDLEKGKTPGERSFIDFHLGAYCATNTNMLVRRKYPFRQAGVGAVREPPLRMLAAGPLFPRLCAEKT